MDDPKDPRKDRHKKTVARMYLTTAIICLLTELIKTVETVKYLLS